MADADVPEENSEVNKKEKNGDIKSGNEVPTLKYFVPPRSTRVFDILVVIFYHMLPFTPLPLFVDALIISVGYRHFGWIAPAAFFTLCAVLVAFPPVYSRRFRNTLRVLYEPLARYVPSAQFIAPTTKVPDQSYIFAFHPHGRMFYSNTMMIQLDHIWRKPFLPKGDLFAAAAAGFFWVPLLRNILYLIGAMPASRGNIIKRLRQGHHVAIVVGGLKEVCVGTEDKVDTLYLLKRKGFIKIAVEENVGVIPIYCFNENQLFCHDPKWLLRFWAWVNKFINIGVPFMRGIAQMPMPFRRDLLCVVGEPLFPEKDESVDQFHARYVKNLRSLFNEYVKLSPSPNQKLSII